MQADDKCSETERSSSLPANDTPAEKTQPVEDPREQQQMILRQVAAARRQKEKDSVTSRKTINVENSKSSTGKVSKKVSVHFHSYLHSCLLSDPHPELHPFTIP